MIYTMCILTLLATVSLLVIVEVPSIILYLCIALTIELTLVVDSWFYLVRRAMRIQGVDEHPWPWILHSIVIFTTHGIAGNIMGRGLVFTPENVSSLVLAMMFTTILSIICILLKMFNAIYTENAIDKMCIALCMWANALLSAVYILVILLHHFSGPFVFCHFLVSSLPKLVSLAVIDVNIDIIGSRYRIYGPSNKISTKLIGDEKELHHLDPEFHNDMCGICHAEWEIGDAVATLSICKHKFHGECLDQWLKCSGCCPYDKTRTD